MSVIEDFKNIFKTKENGMMKIILINIAVFLLANIFTSIFSMNGMQGNLVLNYFALPADTSRFYTRFYSIFTYMFLHVDLIHILFNMIWLYWIGKIYSEYIGSKRLVSTYILGGISGGILFLMVFNLFSVFHSHNILLGASAGVMAVVIGTAVLLPDFIVHLMFIGPVRLKYLALIIFVITTLLNFSDNTGGKIAHIGGALYGWLYVTQYKRGRDFHKLFSLFSNSGKRTMKVAYKKKKSDEEYNANKKAMQEEVDRILDKISKSGYESLNKDEKDFLFKAGK